MNFNIEVRKRQLQSLDQYINSSRNRLLSMLGHLGWSTKKVSEKTDQIGCPINPGHKIPLQNIDKHVQKCCLKSSGYDLTTEYLSEPNVSLNSITIDNTKKIEILNVARSGKTSFKTAWNGVEPDPLTCDRLFTTFSTDERLALYEYCVKNTEPPPTPGGFLVNFEEKIEDVKDLTPQEILQKERNAKRRRIKYKSVHTGRNKSYTEVMREVINNQMDIYQEYLANNSVKVEKTDNTVKNTNEQFHESYQDIPFIQESVENVEKTLSDKVSSVDSYTGHYNEKDDYSDRAAKVSKYHKERSGRCEDERDKRRYRKRSRDRERRYSRSHRNGYDRNHESHRRSDRKY